MRKSNMPAFVVCFAVLFIGLSWSAFAAPSVTFDPISLTVTSGGTFDTPPIIVQEATGITAVTLYVTVPADVTLDTSASGSSLACITQGANVGGLFFAEWNASERKISITCNVASTATLEIIESIEFTAPTNISSEEFTLSGSVTGGSGSPTFTSLTIEPPHTISFTTSPAVADSTIDSGGSTTCSAVATDSLGHTVTYAWSDGGKGGTFSPSASSQNPTYTAAANAGDSNLSVTLTCVATCSQDSSITATGQATLAVRPQLSGDVDQDNDVDKTDADLVLQYLMGDIAETSQMDANGDGSVTIADAQWIMEHPQAGS